jgi:hypothetical protein
LSKSTTASPHSFFVAGATGPFLKAYKKSKHQCHLNTNTITDSPTNQKRKKKQKRDDNEDGNPKKNLKNTSKIWNQEEEL